ncbi:unnamed protein product [Leptosia nina]|uniref:Myosin light chain kinase n=1 Tax=Leptosia nina TaxID=320188 RepID=A0AAV1JXC9_9NEOP
MEATAVLDSEPFEVEEHLRDVIVEERGTVTFLCVLTNFTEDKVRVAWSRNGKRLRNSIDTKINEKKRTHSLELKCVQLNDHGVYNFMFRSIRIQSITKGLLFVKPAQPNIKDGVLYLKAPNRRTSGFLNQLINVCVVVGGTIEFEATLKEKAITVEWYKNNEVIESDERMIFLSDNRTITLAILRAQETDSGIYYIVAKTQQSIESSFASVNVVRCDPYCQLASESSVYIDEAFPKLIEAYSGEEVRLLYAPLPECSFEATVIEPLNSVACYVGFPVIFKCQFEVADPEFCCAIWEVGRYKVERTSHQFNVFCNNTEFLLLIKSVEPDMAGTVLCEICKAIPGNKSHTMCSSAATLTILPNVIPKKIAEGIELRDRKKGFYRSYHKEELPIVALSEKECQSIELRKSILQDISEINETTNHERGSTALHAKALDVKTTTDDEEAGPSGIQSSAVRAVDCKPKKSIFLHVNCPTNSKNPTPKREVVEFQVVPDVDASKDDQNFIMMYISYCQCDDAIYWAEAKSNVPKMFGKLTIQHVKYKNWISPNNSIEETIMIQFEWKKANNYYYIIELHDSNELAGTGIATKSKFKLKEAPLERVIYFSIRAVKGSRDPNAAVFKAPNTKDVEMSPQTATILPMEDYPQLFTETGNDLGRGAFGLVVLVRDNIAGKYYAAKKIKTLLERRRKKAVKEYELLKALEHPKLVKVHLAFTDKQSVILIMDFLWGGELFERLVQEDHIKETDVVVYVRQICEALQYIHRHNILHMDIKPENIICHSPNTRLVKLADFGLARVLYERTVVRAMYGTREYVAPEVLNFEPLTLASDMWSFGVIIFLLLSGVMPFNGPTWGEVVTAMTLAQYDYTDPAFKDISPLAKDFINKLLQPNPASRMTSSQALEHTWLKEGPPSTSNPMRRTRDNLRDYLANQRFRWQESNAFPRIFDSPTTSVIVGSFDSNYSKANKCFFFLIKRSFCYTQRAGNVVIAAHRLRNGVQKNKQ